MEFSERCEIERIEIVGKYKSVHVECATIIEKDGVGISKSYTKKIFNPGFLDDNDTFVETDLSQQELEIQSICNTVWTDEIKSLWMDKLTSERKPIDQENNI